MRGPGVTGQAVEDAGVTSATAVEEVRRRGADPDQLEVYVQPVLRPDDVTEQAAVLVDRVRPRLAL